MPSMKSVSPSNAADDGTSLNASTTKPDDVPHDLETLMLPMILGGKSAQIAFNDIKIPSAHVSSMIKHQMEKKRFFSFFIYLIFYLVFMMSSFDIPENGSTLSIWRAAEALAVKMSRVNNSEGHPTLRFDMSVWSDQSDATSANAWIANSLAAVEMRLLELCPKCKLYRDVTPVSFDGTHSTLSFEKASADASMGTGDQALATLAIERGQHEVLIQFNCKASVAGYTQQVECFETYSSRQRGKEQADNLFLFLVMHHLRMLAMALDTALVAFSAFRRFNNPFQFVEYIAFFEFFCALSVSVCLYFRESYPAWSQTAMALAMLLQWIQFLVLARCFAAFATFANTMLNAFPHMVKFMTSLIVAFLFFAACGHVMFGLYNPAFRTFGWSIVPVFDILMNSFPLDQDKLQHNVQGTYAYYFLVNFAFLLILSQFLIAVLCGSFDSVREAQEEQEEHNSVPVGYVEAWDPHNTWCNGLINQFRWRPKTCGRLSWEMRALFEEYEDLAPLMGHDLLYHALRSRYGAGVSAKGKDSHDDLLKRCVVMCQSFGVVPMSVAEGMSEFTPPEFTSFQIAHLREAFTVFDQDGSGEIDEMEVQGALAQIGMKPTAEQITKMMREVDINGDGVLDFHEFVDMMQREAKAQHLATGRPLNKLSYSSFGFTQFNPEKLRAKKTITTDEMHTVLVQLETKMVDRLEIIMQRVGVHRSDLERLKNPETPILMTSPRKTDAISSKEETGADSSSPSRRSGRLEPLPGSLGAAN